MEILAPVGSLETFYAALAGGADAVYAGTPGFNARHLPTDLRLEELAAMIRYCHSENKKFYLAANSQILENEIPALLEQLAFFEQYPPDALIVQDLGLIHIIRQYFPSLKIHGSTLMTVHNSDGVQFLSRLGCERVVMARELTLKEIETIQKKSGDIELEVFIHGAMCFSYSGLCLFSSYLGGKSSVRGRCVQPCRRGYTTGESGKRRKSAKGVTSQYLFSMNDLSGLSAVPRLRELGVASLKIEGRLRTAHYVKSIVHAYREVVDAKPESMDEALQRAHILAQEAMSRNTSEGYFFSPQPTNMITPHHSGNMGSHLGRFSRTIRVGENLVCRFTTKASISIGDRLRIHIEPSGERLSFRLKSLFVLGNQVAKANAGEKVSISLPPQVESQLEAFAEVYKVDGGGADQLLNDNLLQVNKVSQELVQTKKMRAARVGRILQQVQGQEEKEQFAPVPKLRRPIRKRKGAGNSVKKLVLPWWLRTDSMRVLLESHEFFPDRYLLHFNRHLTGQVSSIKRSLGKRARLVTWALPPVIMENDLGRVRKQIEILLRSGYRSFQLGHVSQTQLFLGQKVHLFGDYTLNMFNSQAALLLDSLGIDACQAAVEGDREMLRQMLVGLRYARRQAELEQGKARIRLNIGCMVYGRPPLFTSRLSPDFFQFDQQILSPRHEPYTIKKKEGYTQILPEKPFSLLSYLEELKQLGMQYVVVDISGVTSKRELAELKERLENSGRYAKLPTFNYLGKLL